MDTKSLAAKATALAASQPSHLGQPTIPPMDWHQEGEILTVIMADGRKVSASIEAINLLMFSQGVGVDGVRSNAKPVQAPAPAKEQPEKPVTPRKRGGKK